MKRWLTGWRLVGLSVALILVAGISALFIEPAPHAVRSQGAIQVSMSRYRLPKSDTVFYYGVPMASESLQTVECALWQRGTNGRGKTCEPGDSSWMVFPGASQEPHTLYLLWYGCLDWSGAGAIIPWQGFNVEFYPASRRLELHCYKAAPVVYLPDRLFGIAAWPALDLFAIPDASFGHGGIIINEDERLEHIVGDQVIDEFQLTTAVTG